MGARGKEQDSGGTGLAGAGAGGQMGGFASEVLEQPAALQRLLDEYGREEAFSGARGLIRGTRGMVFAGMGASLYASQAAACYLNDRGVLAWTADAGELLHYGSRALRRSMPLIAVSQSGESYEIVKLMERVRGGRARPPLLAVTNDPQSALAGLADLTLPLFAGSETGTTSKTFVNSIALLLLLGASLTGDFIAAETRLRPLPERMAGLIGQGRVIGERLVDFLAMKEYLPVIARGPSLASARHGALVLKEAAGVGAEGMSGGAFRHGPFEMLRPGFSAVVFAGGRTGTISQRLAEEMTVRGAKVALLSAEVVPAMANLMPVRLPRAGESELPMLEIVPMQFLAITIGRQRVLTPGELRLSGKVVRREW